MSRPGYPPQDTLLPQAVPRDFSDHTFATKHGVDLTLRLWPAPNSPSNAPWILWTHGGAWCTGSHYAPPSWVIPGFRAKGFHVVGVGYRLAPIVNIKQQIEDCTDGFKWCRQNLAKVLGEDRVDLEAYAIGGDSSGANLSTLLGYHLIPQAKAVVDVYGITDMDHDRYWAETPSKPWTGDIPVADLEAGLADRDPSHAILAAPFGGEILHNSESDTQSRWAVDPSIFSYSPRVRFQTELKNYISTKGFAVRWALQADDFSSTEKARQFARECSAYHLLEQADSYPPIAFLHGRQDMAVPLEQSQKMAERLRLMGVEVLESYEPEVPHGFDQLYHVSRILMIEGQADLARGRRRRVGISTFNLLLTL